MILQQPKLSWTGRAWASFSGNKNKKRDDDRHFTTDWTSRDWMTKSREREGIHKFVMLSTEFMGGRAEGRQSSTG